MLYLELHNNVLYTQRCTSTTWYTGQGRRVWQQSVLKLSRTHLYMSWKLVLTVKWPFECRHTRAGMLQEVANICSYVHITVWVFTAKLKFTSCTYRQQVRDGLCLHVVSGPDSAPVIWQMNSHQPKSLSKPEGKKISRVQGQQRGKRSNQVCSHLYSNEIVCKSRLSGTAHTYAHDMDMCMYIVRYSLGLCVVSQGNNRFVVSQRRARRKMNKGHRRWTKRKPNRKVRTRNFLYSNYPWMYVYTHHCVYCQNLLPEMHNIFCRSNPLRDCLCWY